MARASKTKTHAKKKKVPPTTAIDKVPGTPAKQDGPLPATPAPERAETPEPRRDVRRARWRTAMQRRAEKARLRRRLSKRRGQPGTKYEQGKVVQPGAGQRPEEKPQETPAQPQLAQRQEVEEPTEPASS